MAAAPRILIAGGSGVFGRLLARELLQTTAARLVLAGRDRERVTAICGALGDPDRVQPLTLDLSNPKALARAASGCFAVVGAAGPVPEPAERPACRRNRSRRPLA